MPYASPQQRDTHLPWPRSLQPVNPDLPLPLPYPRFATPTPTHLPPSCAASAFPISFLIPTSWSHRLRPRPPSPAAAPPPAFTDLSWAALPVFLAGRGRGVHREAVDPSSSKAQAARGISGRWRGGGPLTSEINP